jgi:hypothetical protein
MTLNPLIASFLSEAIRSVLRLKVKVHSGSKLCENSNEAGLNELSYRLTPSYRGILACCSPRDTRLFQEMARQRFHT